MFANNYFEKKNHIRFSLLFEINLIFLFFRFKSKSKIDILNIP